MMQNLREMLAPVVVEGAPARPRLSGARLSGAGWGYVLGGLGAMFFSLKAVLIKLAYMPGKGQAVSAVDPITLLVLRLGFALPVYILVLLWALRMRPKTSLLRARDVIYTAALGATSYYLCAFLDFTGLQYITAQLERMLLFTYPVFVLILGALFFGRRISVWGVASIVVAYSGIAVIFAGGDISTGANVTLGSALILLTALLFATFQLLAVGFIKILGSQLFTCVAMISATVVASLHFLVVNGGQVSGVFDLPSRIYVLGFLLAGLSTLIPSFMVNIALGRIGAQAVAILGMFGPVATIISAVTILGEGFGLIDALGTALVMLGIGVYTLVDKPAKSPPASSDSAPHK